MMRLLTLSFLLLSAFVRLTGQDYGWVRGTVADSLDQPVDLANVAILGRQEGTMTDENGTFQIRVPSEDSFTIVVSCVGFRTERFTVNLQPGETEQRRITLRRDVQSLKEVSVSARQERASTFRRINVKELNYMPTTTGKVEAIIKSDRKSTRLNSSHYS